MDIPLCRLRQVAAVIVERREGDERLSQAKLEWQTKVLASFIAGTAASGKAVKALLKQVKDIHLLPETEPDGGPALIDAQGGLTWDPENPPPIPEDRLPSVDAVTAAFGSRGQ